MKEQEKIEKALKDIHILFAKCETMPDDTDRVIVSKKQLFGYLEEINRCMYQMMDSYEITKESRERQERKTNEKCEKIIADSNRVAEDIYAAAVMYTDDTMKALYEEIRKTQTEVVHMTEMLADEIDRKLRTVVDNRAQLREQLTDTEQSEKYLRMLRAEAKKNRTEDTAVDDDLNRPRPTSYKAFAGDEDMFRHEAVKIVAPAPQIKVDPAYEQHDYFDEEEGVVMPSEPNIQVNYDSAYFKMKQAQMGIDDDFVEGVIDKDEEKKEVAPEPEKKVKKPAKKRTASKQMEQSDEKKAKAEFDAAEKALAAEVAELMKSGDNAETGFEEDDDLKIADLYDEPEEFLVHRGDET